MTTQTIAPVRRQVTVEASVERAFEVFTQRMATWWKAAYHIGAEPFADVRLEAGAGGRWFEVDAAGNECTWGKVLAWEPPTRLVLAWQISARWAYDPDLVTELEVRFTAQGPTTTLVELEHRNLERFGDQAAATRDQLDGDDGWAGLLGLFAAAA